MLEVLSAIHTLGVGEGKHTQCVCKYTDEKEKLRPEFCLCGTIKRQHQVEEPLASVNILAPGLPKQHLWVNKVICTGLLPLLKNRLRESQQCPAYIAALLLGVQIQLGFPLKLQCMWIDFLHDFTGIKYLV